jgi:hypothetical protein
MAGKQEGFSTRPHHSSGTYEIHVRGHLTSDWADWLEGFEMHLLENGEMTLVGPVVDQAALIGLINKLYRLNLALLSIHAIEERKNEPHTHEKSGF